MNMAKLGRVGRKIGHGKAMVYDNYGLWLSFSPAVPKAIGNSAVAEFTSA
jgi:hypothetical protein